MAGRDMTGRDPIAEARQHWRDAGWGEAADGMAAVTSVMRAQQILLGRIDALLKPFGISFARFELLRLLAFARGRSVRMSRAREVLQVHPASVTSIVDRLEKDGLVSRHPDPRDGRAVLVELTAEGARVVEEATAVLNDHVFTDLGLDEADLASVFGVLETFRRRNGDFGALSGAGSPGSASR
ncbi:MAG: MarR family transcriptional regulator [Propionibacteriaceae bacterium]|nr:MarR family transcriptional regulator [Propionibacteriaceae bacterium]